VGVIASETENRKTMRLHPYDQIVETVDCKTRGELLVTSLTNFAMPMIRYRIGDVGKIRSVVTKEGRLGVAIEALEGRTSDSITLRNGRIIHGEYITHVFYGMEGIKQFQFIQKSYDRFLLYLVCSQNVRGVFDERITKKIKRDLGDEIELRIEYVDRIQPNPKSGKYRFTISEVTK
jgi:phenylacetate-CoA ligase